MLWRGYVRIEASVGLEHVFLVVADAKEHLTHVDEGGEEARDGDDHVYVGEERVDDGVELRIVVNGENGGDGRVGVRAACAHLEYEVDEEDEHVAAETHDAVRFADDDCLFEVCAG